MLKLPKPKFICIDCRREFVNEKPGPTDCPFCNSHSVSWVNYSNWVSKSVVSRVYGKKYPKDWKGEEIN